MKTFVIDASIAIKWVIDEAGTPEALTLRRNARLIAPELLTTECANILWKKFQRRELSREEALLAARLIQAADIDFVPSHSLLEPATRLAIELDHPAYDCFYLALAIQQDCQFVTADERFVRKVGEGRRHRFRTRVISASDAAAELERESRDER